MNIYNLINEIKHEQPHYVGEPLDNFLFKETKPWVFGKNSLTRNLIRYKLKYNLRIKHSRLGYYDLR